MSSIGHGPGVSASETVSRVVRREESAVEVIRAALDRVERIGDLRAFTEVWVRPAMARAHRVDAALARGDELPLAGVPLAVKATEGTESAQARRLIAAGALPVGATAVPGPGTPWKTWGHTERGPTLNPWRHDLVPGGSSAGSAVAVATGAVPLATGSDGAGSTRIPAAWCAVVGYKPTTGLLPARDRAGLTVGGPLVRCVSDAVLYRRVVLGHAPEGSPPRPRVAWSPTLGFNEPDPEVLAVAEKALRRWTATGAAKTVEVHPALTDPAASWVARREHHDENTHETTDRHNRAVLDDLFSSVDLLATPTTPNRPHPHEGPGDELSVGYTWLFNLTGHPAISLPAGFTSDGLPVGLHLVAAHHRDGLLLAAAADHEKTLEPRHIP